ncbi:MAG: 3-hydroxyacyl-CoA dehydrogenase [Actinomycetia bacterium]|nr:3-hydroxyacyl-CoA dehydrogenase [Actinomycetes bacterium]
MSHNIGIVGAGSIGIGWAVVFATAGYRVHVCEVNEDAAQKALPRIKEIVSRLNHFGLESQSPEHICEFISVYSELAPALSNCDFVFEAGPENLEQKIDLLGAISEIVPDHAVISSSSSAITASSSGLKVKGRERFLIVHPANPPFLIRVAEIVTTPETEDTVVDRVSELLTQANMSPVQLHKEQLGFAFNRLQGALLREAYSLVADGVLSAPDVDTLVREGLALRWAVTGPFVTSHLNVPGGLRAHAARMGASYYQMALDRENTQPWSPELVDQVASEIEMEHPLTNWEHDVQDRDDGIMLIAQARAAHSAR